MFVCSLSLAVTVWLCVGVCLCLTCFHSVYLSLSLPLTPHHRSHPGSEPHKDAQFYDNPTSLQQYLRMARVFRAWSFYRRQLMEEAASTGVPVRRHMRIEFPMIDPSLDVALQFMIGSAILVAPVVTPDATTVDAFLPAGTSWQLVWDRTNTFVGAS